MTEALEATLSPAPRRPLSCLNYLFSLADTSCPATISRRTL